MKLRIIPCLLAFIVAGQSLESAELSGEATFFKRYCWSCHDANDNTELSDLFLTVLHRQGITLDSFGQSNGLLSW